MRYDSLSDHQLVERFKDGDRRAYATIVSRYQDRVFTMCIRWMSCNRAVAEEVSQDVFLALYKSLERFRGDAKLSTWIYRVTVNHCKNRRTYQKRRKLEKHEALEGRAAQSGGPVREFSHSGPGTDARLQRQEAAKHVHAALAEIEEEQREIILLRDVQDLGYDEISEILGVARGTVKSRLHRARASLAKALNRRLSAKDVF